MKKRLKDMEDEAAALREMQAKVEKEMSSVQGFFRPGSLLLFLFFPPSPSHMESVLFSEFFNF